MAGFEALEKDGYRVGSKSQKILWALRNRGADRDWIRGSALRSVAGLSQNRQVFYRIERYLEPAGLVEEKERRREDDPRAFRLTDEGERWVNAHEETLAATVGRRATLQLAHEAMDEAAAAKESVQEYRKKLHSVKTDVDGLKEQSQAHADRLEELKSANDKIAVNASRIDKVEENKADEQESRERLREVKQEFKDENRRLRERATTLESAVDDAQDTVETLREENTILRERLDAIEAEPEKSWIEKIRRQ